MKKDLIILAITWAGSLVMLIVFVVMMATENMKVERQYRSQRSQRARVVRMKVRGSRVAVNY